MLPDVLATAAATLLPLVIGAIVVCALASATESVLSLRWRNLRHGIANLLLAGGKDSHASGKSARQIHADCTRDATRILLAPDNSRLTWIHPEQFFRAVVEVTGVDPQQAHTMRSAFTSTDPALRKRFGFHMRIWVFAWSLLLSLTYLELLPAAGFPPWETWSVNMSGIQSVHLGRLADLFLATVLIALGAQLCFRAFRKQLGDDSEFAPTPVMEKETTRMAVDSIGCDDCAVRAINFAGGGFSTIMQLGVTHALMTIQGRAPDAVIGVSAGAVQAAALAEVLQAGESIESEFKPWQTLDGDKKLALQSQRMQARVIRFREFLHEFQTAREELFDSVLPDAYQVDSHEPLEPLQSALYDSKEREERLSSLESESGLARLYNDLLLLKIPVGIIVRVIRRVLDIQAAGNILSWYFRAYSRFLESVKVWLLLGGVLARASPVLGPIRRALLSGAAHKVTPSTAESIIFRFSIARNIQTFLEVSSNFLILLVLWLGIGLLPAAVPAWIWDPAHTSIRLAIWILFAYVFIPLAISALIHRSPAAFAKTFKGLVQALWLLVKWTAVLYLFLGVSVALVTGIAAVISTGSISSLIVNADFLWTRGLLLQILRIIPVLTLIVLGLLLIRYMRQKFRVFRGLLGTAEPSTVSDIACRLLGSYRLSASLFSAYPFKSIVSRLFDKDYFGTVEMDTAIENALTSPRSSSDRIPAKRKTVGHYSSKERHRPIHVGLAVANVANGVLEAVSPEHSVVDGLVAAFAVVPIFPPKLLGGRLYVDGANVANVPTRALLSVLRGRINPNSRGVHIYSVVPLPFSRQNLYSEDNQSLCLNLWETAMKALFLQRFRDAVLERHLTELYTRIIPKKDSRGKPNYSISVDDGTTTRQYFRGWVTPVELEEPVSLNGRILTADKEERHQAILETVADGCRASLETMIRFRTDRPISCPVAVEEHLRRQASTAHLTDEIVAMRLPGSGDKGPGLKEVCEHCALYRDKKKLARPQTLKLSSSPDERPPWPHERSVEDQPFDEPPVPPITLGGDPNHDPFASLKEWPRGGPDEPTVSMLFSGGVFRGVYQMGVLNALHLLNLRPDVIAGASVGSITAGMITKVFSGDPGGRQKDIARLASIYLGIDRLILTDRFSDFIRNLTIRAAATKFSISEADEVFRKYDFPSADGYSRSARNVIAGIERSLYVNPYQLNALVRSVRNADVKTAFGLARDLTQQWLDRMNIGEQVLGADALETLIQHFVMPGGPDNSSVPRSFDVYDEEQIHLLATTTNITKGQLEILGGIDAETGTRDSAALVEGLLASSAFPGVFKPRLSHDIRPGTSDEHQYIDGGVMDNFPIDSVIQFLLAAQFKGRIGSGFDTLARPHLIFAASLQINTPEFQHPDQWKALERNWPALLARTKELGYNTKLDTYEAAERQVREIYTKVCEDARAKGKATDYKSLCVDFTPLNVEVVNVKPEWLCGTFAFHPMLGFRRRNQAMSIAHGCASTLLKFKNVDGTFRKAWKVSEKAIPVETGVGRAWEYWRDYKKDKSNKTDGKCWLRPEEDCPFSRASLTKMNQSLIDAGEPPVPAIEYLATIYEHCADPSTHMPGGASVGWFERLLRRHQVIP